MNIAQTLLAAYQDPNHVSHNDLRGLLSAALAASKTADQHFDGGTVQYGFSDNSSLTVQTVKQINQDSNVVNLDVRIVASI